MKKKKEKKNRKRSLREIFPGTSRPLPLRNLRTYTTSISEPKDEWIAASAEPFRLFRHRKMFIANEFIGDEFICVAATVSSAMADFAARDPENYKSTRKKNAISTRQ